MASSCRSFVIAVLFVLGCMYKPTFLLKKYDCDKNVRSCLPCNCRQRENCMDTSATSCSSGCETGYIGPFCQYKTFPVRPLKDEPPLPDWMWRNNVSQDTCTSVNRTFVKAGLAIPSRLALIRILWRHDYRFLEQPMFFVYDENNFKRMCPPGGKYSAGYIDDIHCWTPFVVHAISVEGPNVKKICMLQISPGRDIALKHENADESKEILKEVNGDHRKKTNERLCSWRTSYTQDLSFYLKWPDDIIVNLIKIRPPSNMKDYLMPTAVYLHSEEDTKSFSKFRVNGSLYFASNGESKYKNIWFYTEGKTSAVCEIEVYGEERCPDTRRWGIRCERKCLCKNTEEKCHMGTGTCISGCDEVNKGVCIPAVCSPHCRYDGFCEKDTKVCLDGCKENYSGPDCMEKCDGESCNNKCSWHCLGKCDKNLHCKGRCEAGYMPPDCRKECPPRTYGYNCTQKCLQTCRNGMCNKATGHCDGRCSDGYLPPDCKRRCEKGHYGYRCATECSKQCEDKICDHKTGHCDACEPGFAGDKCDESCPHGTYGQTCAKQCSPNCKDRSCNPITGYCTDCPSGKSGLLCDKGCLTGLYGSKCEHNCSKHCKGKVKDCDHISGECKLGCDDNEKFKPRMCIECVSKRLYGENCTKICKNCDKNGCNMAGKCVQGCAEGWSGKLCEIATPQSAMMGPSSEDDMALNPSWLALYFLVGFAIGLLFYFGATWKSKKKETPENETKEDVGGPNEAASDVEVTAMSSSDTNLNEDGTIDESETSGVEEASSSSASND